MNLLWCLVAIVMNVATFLLFAYDKRCAQRGRWRVDEITLLAFALAGGSLGALVAMQAFHHKTRKRAFQVSVPLFLAIHIVIIFAIL